MGINVVKAVAIALIGILVKGLHGILQAAGSAHHRHSAITQGNQLPQAARLILGRHQEQVRACIDALRQLVGEADVGGYLGRQAPLQSPEPVLILLVACAQQHKLALLRLQKLIHNADNQIQALGCHQAGHQADHRNAAVNRQPQLLLQLFLVVSLLADSISSIVDKQVRVRLRVVHIVVNAVNDADNILPPGSQEAIQLLTEVRILDFLGIGTADSADHISVDDAALHKVDSIMELQVTVVEILPIQSQNIVHNLLAEHALILQVVNGEYRLDVGITLVSLMLQLQEHIDKSRMPVIGIDYIREKIKKRQKVQDSP